VALHGNKEEIGGTRGGCLGEGRRYRVSTRQGKLEKVAEFVWSGKCQKNIIFEKSGKMILDHANCRYL